jgi:ribokinase
MPTKKNKYDIVSIGDCTIDAFVEVEEASVHCNADHEKCQLCFSYGEKILYENLSLQSAGNANNVAVGMSRLGHKTGFYSSVGADLNGEVILKQLKKEKVDTKFISVQKDNKTNFHLVLAYHGDRTILIKHQDFHYALPKGIESTDWIYLTSVGTKGLGLHPQIVKLLQENPNIKMSFNPGTYQLRTGLKKLLPLFKRTEILFVNKEEAQGLVAPDEHSIPKLLELLHNTGPKTVVVTDGMNGSFCLDNGVIYTIGVYPHKPVEATGAGDSYATGFTAAKMHGLDTLEAMRWGGRNGASVATKVGPQPGLLTRKEMESSLKSKKDFKAQIVNPAKE